MAERTRHRLAFDRYWSLGRDRSVEHLHEVLRVEWTTRTPGLRTLFTWSSQYHWQSRIVELEHDAQRVQHDEQLQATHEMYERQAKEGLLLQQRGAEWLTRVDADEASPDTAIRAIVEGAKLERLARGEPGERDHDRSDGGETHDPRFTDFSTDELRRLVESAERAVGRAGETGTE